MQNLTLQYDLRPALPNIYGTSDYREFRDTLIQINSILENSGLEKRLVDQAVNQWVIDKDKDIEKFYQSKEADRIWKLHAYALRCNVARTLLGEGFREFSIHLSDSELLQWFTSIHFYGSRKATSKSALGRYRKYFETSALEKVIKEFLSQLSSKESANEIGLLDTIDCGVLFSDTTCVKANIHFPVDWVLLRDAAKSLLSAIKTIRSQGLKHRMIEPATLLKQMNKLCIEMTHTRRKKDGKKSRKFILRKMKKLSQCIAKHGQRYQQLLEKNIPKTAWTEAQANQVIDRIENILIQLPAAMKQAHERIIGERQVASKDKILSLYDPDVHVLVRGKSGNEVEFGQGLLLTEQSDGLIVDWELFQDQPKAESQLVEAMIHRARKYYGNVDSLCTDRGYHSKKNDDFLKKENIYNAICPKNPHQLKDRLREPKFASLQTRRSQTEGRIGIFKNGFLGKPLRSKGFSSRRTSVAWCVLTHNLWVLARIILFDEQGALKKAA